ncbi:HNH endonuclease signature motif containing protein [Bdellovibrionota bacterium FG-1]
MLGTSMRECEKKLEEISPASALPPEKTRQLSQGKTLIQFSADAELMKKIEKLKGLLAHQNSDGSYEGLFEILAEVALKKFEPKKPNPESPQPEPSGNDANTPSVSTLETQRSRTIPAEVKRQVFARDGGCCTYQDQSTGKRCGSRFAIEYDHIQPFAWEGETNTNNLQLRCRRHNAYTAKKQGLSRDSKSL